MTGEGTTAGVRGGYRRPAAARAAGKHLPEGDVRIVGAAGKALLFQLGRRADRSRAGALRRCLGGALGRARLGQFGLAPDRHATAVFCLLVSRAGKRADPRLLGLQALEHVAGRFERCEFSLAVPGKCLQRLAAAGAPQPILAAGPTAEPVQLLLDRSGQGAIVGTRCGCGRINGRHGLAGGHVGNALRCRGGDPLDDADLGLRQGCESTIGILLQIGVEQIALRPILDRFPIGKLSSLVRRRLPDRRRLAAIGRLQHHLAGQRGIVPGHLLAAGCRKNVAAHLDQLAGDVASRLAEMLEQRRCKGRVSPAAVERDIAGLGGKGDQRADAGADLGKSAADRGRSGAHGAGEIDRERIVATGIKQHDIDPGAALHRRQDQVHRHRLEIEIDMGGELGVDRGKIIFAVHLKTMAGIVEKRQIGAIQTVDEIAQYAPHAREVEIHTGHHLEAEPFELGRHVGSVIAGIGQRRHMLIGGIADDQRHALLGKRLRGAKHQ
ncbi:hypothetical protein D9M68_522720 [compost metagenome]